MREISEAKLVRLIYIIRKLGWWDGVGGRVSKFEPVVLGLKLKLNDYFQFKSCNFVTYGLCLFELIIKWGIM